ncbi:AAA domain-containing protein [Neobacillus sp. PS3-34]|uniref:DEAD/DEAH box helicase n=1 Tax=Neobacillus sp. PS3-34 TaxID=3070678 RepID=UPI0027E05443|nr:AAA domain-containing protein [Neobacillus sp. PS3-34]WML50508.1 AAA domain-containing protein [Neobacillus sp. PS3-34]
MSASRPPGTGKTTVIAEAIYQFTKQGKKVILASQANLAVDNVFERLANSPEIRAIRLGKERKLSEEGKQFSEKQVLKWFYSSISSGIREKFIKRWTDRDHKLEELQHLMDDTKFVKADLSRYADTILQFQQLVQQTNFQLKQEEQYINKIREQARVNMETKENIIKLKDYINHSNETNFNIPAYLLNFIFQNFLEPAKTLEKHHIILDEFWLKNDDRLSDSEKTKAFKLFWNKWGNLKKFLPKLEQDILSFRQASGGLDVSTMYEIQELEQKIKEIEVEMEEDASKFTIWRKIRNEIKELKNNRTAVLDEGYSTIFNGMINGEKYSDILKSKLEADKTELSEELLYIYQDIIKLEQIINESMQPLFSEMDKYYKSISEAAVDESKYKKLQAELSRHQLELKGLYERYNEKQKLLSSLYNDMRKHSDDDFSDEEAVDAANAIISALNNISQADKKFEDDWKPLFEEWTSMLENEKTAKNDYEYYLEIYLDACNVVGVTCTENARVLEENNHTIFDIAIIDEVSKATPPELLMPMIRAKKTILVGDHRQLPPIFKEQESSYEELIKQLKEEQDELPPEEQTFDDKLLNVENFDRFKSMVTASLFKDYFEQADPTIKEALLTQYRMHPDIMDVINQFYENRLKCGITNPDEVRNHGLTITSPEGLEFITPDRHAIWIDTSKNPFGEQNFEEQMGTSKINTLESILIAETLKKIDEQYTKAGVKGKKDVGVISFYGKQVGEIRRRIRNIKFESINVDINTVDKFQGKEKSIILVSLVRNKNVRKKSQNSFVAAFERINVAFSRAKELLVVLGAKDMFYDYDVELPNMDNTGSTTKRVYRDIMDRLQLKGCLWESRRVITPEQYHQLMTKQADKEKKLQTISN